MKTYIADIIPKIQRYSEKLDNITLLTSLHWVVIDDIENTKSVYIFRSNNELLIASDGKVTKAHWEYLGHNSLLIDLNDESYLFKQGFFDENILALKIDSKNEYAFLVSETKFEEELNTLAKIIAFLANNYYLTDKSVDHKELPSTQSEIPYESIQFIEYKTNKGIISIETRVTNYATVTFNYGNKVLKDGKPAPTGKYRLGFMWHIFVEDGKISEITVF